MVEVRVVIVAAARAVRDSNINVSSSQPST